jgi:hypothetical protein
VNELPRILFQVNASNPDPFLLTLKGKLDVAVLRQG